MIEEADFDVTLIIRLSTRVAFAPIERDGPITRSDAIENAIGQFPPDFDWTFGGEFGVAYPFDAEVERID